MTDWKNKFFFYLLCFFCTLCFNTGCSKDTGASSAKIEKDKKSFVAADFHRVPIDELSLLPQKVRQILKKRGCHVTKGGGANGPEYGDKSIENTWSSGSLLDEGQKDYVVMCLYGSKSKIEVFFGGSQKCEPHPSFTKSIDENTTSYYNNKIVAFSRSAEIGSRKGKKVLTEITDSAWTDYECRDGKFVMVKK